MTDYLLDTNHASPLVTPGHRLRPRIWGALRYHLVLLTIDRDFEVVPELRYENWLA